MDILGAAEAHMQSDYDGSQVFRRVANYVGLSVDLVITSSP